jgi:hypothetical protein
LRFICIELDSDSIKTDEEFKSPQQLNFEGSLLSLDEREELDAEIMNQVRDFKTSKVPYIEDIKVANCKFC